MNANETAASRARASVAALRGLVAQVETTLDTLRGEPLTSDSIAASGKALDETIARCRRLLAEIRLIDPADLPQSEFDQHTDGNLNLAKALNLTLELSERARKARDQIRRASGVSGDAQLYIANDGDTLQRIAARFYGTTAQWTLLADANGRTTVSAGDVVVIPNPRRATS